jgi:hypothetical protein
VIVFHCRPAAAIGHSQDELECIPVKEIGADALTCDLRQVFVDIPTMEDYEINMATDGEITIQIISKHNYDRGSPR